MVTIKDIAKAANVSSGTVSNVLNKKGNVTEEKIRRVEEAVMRLGYEVNESARILRKKTRNSIVLTFEDPVLPEKPIFAIPGWETGDSPESSPRLLQSEYGKARFRMMKGFP